MFVPPNEYYVIFTQSALPTTAVPAAGAVYSTATQLPFRQRHEWAGDPASTRGPDRAESSDSQKVWLPVVSRVNDANRESAAAFLCVRSKRPREQMAGSSHQGDATSESFPNF